MYRARKHWRALAVAVVAACGPAATPSPLPADSPAAAAPEAVAPPTAPWMNRVAAEEIALGDLIDPDRGVIAAAYYTDASDQDPRADDTGLVKIAERLCGDEARELGAQLAEDLSRRLAQSEDGAPLFRCREWECVHEAAGEYDLDGRYRFAARGGRRWLDAVIRVEGGPITAAFVAEAEAWIESQLPALEAAPCP